jgi:hypothetical protein
MVAARHDGIAIKKVQRKNRIVLKRKNQYATIVASKNPTARL